MPAAEFMGMALGGVLAAVFFGLSGVLSKAAAQAGVGLGPYIILAGAGVVGVGVLFTLLVPGHAVSRAAVTPSIGVGALWGLGAGLVALSLSKYHVPLSKLVPLYNMNTLVAVLVALWIFAEWEKVHALKLIIGAILVMLGGTLVALA
ncbi:MAG TPA: hypothetical protein PKV72_04575 [Candidatus Peribacteria bacterium]|nr:hypothetical protein [Candidatus Peribacteria bacterium]